MLNCFIRTTIFAGAACLLLSTAGCRPKTEEKKSSKLSFVFPSGQELNSSNKNTIASSGYDFSNGCYAVNITAADLPITTTGQCDLPIGVFQGFVPPGTSISVDVPRGKSRKLQILAYQKVSVSDPCPTGRTNISDLALARLAQVGMVASFDAEAEEVTLHVKMTAPTTTLAQQMAMPAACQPSNGLPSSFPPAKVASGYGIQTGGNFKAHSTVSGLNNEVLLQGGNYRARLSRRVQ